MTKSELIEVLKKYHKGEIYIHQVLTAVESYSSASNNGNAIVSGALPLVEALDKYIELLVEELNETVSIAATHGWKSSRVEIGEQLRDRIAELKRQ